MTDRPLTDEEIQKANVGGLKELNSQIVLEEYNPHWPVEFERQKSLIQKALPHVDVSIEHVGSTSVPGMAAKPIIDIVLEVPDSSRESEYVPQLERNGFKLQIREPEWYEHRMLRGLTYQVNLHVFTKGCPEVTRMIKFRDRLRANRVDFDLYLSKKRKLAAKTWKYVQNYADAKTQVIREICSRFE